MEPIKFSEKDNTIEFHDQDPLPVVIKKFRKSSELKSLYKFIHENDLRKEAFQIINTLFKARKDAKAK